jgi:4-amino-4-deoxy-L-arabinose transferase-like glycosyltransferase
MPLRRPGLVTALPAWACRLVAALLILSAAALHLAYLAYHCPLDLAPDEAHYWDWSRHLDWSYYSKGPLVAYLIRGGVEVAGPWSVRHTGNLMFAVRLPAIVCGSLLLAALYTLAVQVYGSHRLGLGVVGAAVTLPLIAAGSSLMTIDAPYTCCWAWALVLAHRAVFRGSAWAWPATGLLVGIGILAKYTMAAFVPSLGLFLLFTPACRRSLLRPGYWCMTGVAALCCLPILIWNAQHQWVTVRHLLGLSGFAEAKGEVPIHWLGPLNYAGGQCALLLGYWFAVWLMAMIVHHPLRERDDGVRYLWWLSAPMFLVFAAFSFKTNGGELNWPVTAYLSGLVLGAAWLGRQLSSPLLWFRRLTQALLTLACAGGLLLIVFVHESAWAYPLLSQVVGPATEHNPMPLRRVDPTCRLRGWRKLAAEVDKLRDELRQSGDEPVLAGCSWNIPGELGLYCDGHPQAYCVGWLGGERHSQYDLWRNPFDNLDDFRGRTFIVVGDPPPSINEAFTDEVLPPRQVRHYENGQLVTMWTIHVYRGFHGFPPLPQRSSF